jgi:AraC family transcriptional regulator, melibiose operon regulatory protein
LSLTFSRTRVLPLEPRRFLYPQVIVTDIYSSPHGLLGWYGEPWVIERLHHHSDIELNLVSNGELHYLMGGATLTIGAGEVAVYWAVTPHRIITCQPASTLGVLHIPLTEFLRWQVPATLRETLLRGQALKHHSPDPTLDTALFKRWASELQRTPRPAINPDPIERHQAVLLEAEAFLHRLARLTDAPASAVLGDLGRSTAERLAQLIAERHAENISAQLIAQALGLHPNYAMTVFKQAFGLTMREFLTQHRVAHAQRLLVTTDLSVLDIASESGFQSVSRFYAVFARASKQTPLAYRQRHGHDGL